ncbi:hypothetical protein BKD03_04005 [Brucella sp. 09RB8471]|nr:hypothetical protein BKD03_04005 [Brucella sp. 09RB8471]
MCISQFVANLPKPAMTYITARRFYVCMTTAVARAAKYEHSAIKNSIKLKLLAEGVSFIRTDE